MRREGIGESWADADEKRKRELRRQPIVPLDYPESVAADWPELLTIVEEKVKPARLQSSQRSKSSHGRRAGVWWQIYHQAKDLQAAITPVCRAKAGVGNLRDRSARRVRVSTDGRGLFAYDDRLPIHDPRRLLQRSNPAPTNSGRASSARPLKDRLRYTPSDCFETFPFPENWETHPEP